MAHITLSLVWYRLTELGSNIAEGLDDLVDWYREFNLANLDVLDLLVLAWIIFGISVFVIVKIIERYKSVDHHTTQSTTVGKVHNVGSDWVNSVISWFYLSYNHTPECIDAWIKAINEELRNKFDNGTVFNDVRSGSLPPTISSVHTESGPNDSLTLTVNFNSKDLGFIVTVSSLDQPPTRCHVNILKFCGEVDITINSVGEGLQVTAQFKKRPSVNLAVKPESNTAEINVTKIGDNIRDAICSAVVTFTLASQSGLSVQDIEDEIRKIAPSRENSLQGAPPKPPRTPDKRVLIKVLKASGLGAKECGCTAPYCIVEADRPPQKHVTSIVRNTVNPFWDENFLLDIDKDTKVIKLQVLDRDRPAGEDFLGQALVNICDIQQHQSSRQILPLKGYRGENNKGGNITFEILFMEPAAGVDVADDQKANGTDVKIPGEERPTVANLVTVDDGQSVTDVALQHVENRSRSKTPTKTSTLVITTVQRTPDEESLSSQNTPRPEGKRSFGSKIKQRFNNIRSRSTDRASTKEESFLKPPEVDYPKRNSEGDLDSYSATLPSMSKVSRSGLGGSFKRLFRRKKRDKHSKGDISGESSRASTLSYTSTPTKSDTLGSPVQLDISQPGSSGQANAPTINNDLTNGDDGHIS